MRRRIEAPVDYGGHRRTDGPWDWDSLTGNRLPVTGNPYRESSATETCYTFTMRLAVFAPPQFPPLDRLAEAHDVEVVASVGDAEAILLAPRFGSVLVDHWREMQNVQWIHTLAAGVETLPFDLLRSREVTVTNSRGIYADALAEFVIAAMLWFAKDLRRLVTQQNAREWKPFTVDRLEGQTLAIIGYGSIGEAIGRRASALGMRLLTVRRRLELGDPTIDEVIPDADYIALSLPLTTSTRGLVSAARIARMKSNAVLINVSRGTVVDEGALVEALAEGRIRGAALDVFATEPLPPEHRLWELDNVLLSPHSADHTADAHDRAMTFFLENLNRFQRGDSLQNVVDKDEGY
jgi:phosphoglycerate dehydrogenase-like enzyme